MGFEKVVLEKVAKIVKADNLAGFTCGTLFVICNESEAREIVNKLTKDMMTKIQVSRAAPHEYAFDFVA